MGWRQRRRRTRRLQHGQWPGQAVERTDDRVSDRRSRRSCGHARWRDPALTSIMESKTWRRCEPLRRGAEIHLRGGARPVDFGRRKPEPFVITSSRGMAESQSFPGDRWVVLPGVERLRKWPKTAFHRATTAIHRESRSPNCRGITGQLSIGGGFHTFLRRAVFGCC